MFLEPIPSDKNLVWSQYSSFVELILDKLKTLHSKERT